MQMNKDEYSVLSDLYHKKLMTGMIGHASDTLKKMARVLDKERKYMDELKVLMLAFAFDLCPCMDPVRGKDPFIDPWVISSAQKVIAWKGITMYDVEELYFETIKPDTTPEQVVSVDYSYCLFKLCIEGKYDFACMNLARMT